MSTNRKRKFPDSAADEKIEDETIVQTTPHLNDTNIKILEIDNEIGEVKKKIDEVEVEIKKINEKIDELDNKKKLSDREKVQLEVLREDKRQLQEKENKLREDKRQLREDKRQLQEKEIKLLEKENIILLNARTPKGPYCIISSIQEIIIYSLYFPSFIMIIGPPNPITHQYSSGSHFTSPCSRVKYDENYACKFANEVQIFSKFNPQVKVFVRFQNAQPLEGKTKRIISLMKENCKALHEDFKKIEELLLVNESSSSNSLKCDFTKLRSMAEEEFQEMHLNKFSCKHSLDDPHQNHNCKWLDTHNKAHKTVCVSLVEGETEMVNFGAKPDLVSCHVPRATVHGCKRLQI